MRIPFSEIEDAILNDNGVGFCLECGESQYGCEPDACNYTCEVCSAPKVFGAEEILLRDMVDHDK